MLEASRLLGELAKLEVNASFKRRTDNKDRVFFILRLETEDAVVTRKLFGGEAWTPIVEEALETLKKAMV